ncbi:MAG: outer membrane protein transport protein [Deltaproteobacteria bacterium]|nr:outer membrane protein transport protein [Deltaproteobacteria bacterium]
MSKVGTLLFGVVVCSGGAASAGGLYLPGSGAISTSRAGAAIASTDNGEALGINPAGLAKTTGTTITLSMAFIDYAMKFQRRGTYDDVPDVDLAYEGQPYPLVEDASGPALGIGGFQPIPVFVVTTDLGGVVPGLRLAAGIYAPNSYPFRDLCTHQPGAGCQKYEFDRDPDELPSPARYDVVTRDAVLFMPTLAASYRILPNLDIGGRFGWGFADASSSVHVWAAPGNVVEDVGGDGLLQVQGKDNFVPSYGFGLTYRPTPAIELAAVYNSEISIDAKGTARTTLGPRSGSSGIEVMVVPLPDDAAQCAKGGVIGAFKACITAELPRSATIGGRYRFFGVRDEERGDIELDVGWENWGNPAATDYRVQIDSEIVTAMGGGLSIKKNVVRHGFQDVFNARLGGSWRFSMADNVLIARGGIGYDSAAAKPGWQRADIDGAARTTITAGAGFRTKRFQIDAGFGVVLEGSNNNPGDCNPISPLPADLGCNRDGVQASLDDRQGPDPINPLVVPEQQLQAPVNQGVFESHYIMFMLGATTWF